MRNCPKCNHQGVRRSHRYAGERLLTAVLPVRPYRCKSCGARFWWLTSDEKWRRSGRQVAITGGLVLVVALGLVYVTNLPESRPEPVPEPAGAQRAEQAAAESTHGPDDAADAPLGAPGEPSPTPATAETPPSSASTPPESAQADPAEDAEPPGWSTPERPSDPRNPEMLGIRATVEDTTLQLEILTDEPPRHWEIYQIDQRLVIDLLGSWQARKLVAPPIEHPLFSRARIGQHQDLVRIVVDLARPARVTHQASATDGSLVVRLSGAADQ